jgi:hypothetical protein
LVLEYISADPGNGNSAQPIRRKTPSPGVRTAHIDLNPLIGDHPKDLSPSTAVLGDDNPVIEQVHQDDRKDSDH